MNTTVDLSFWQAARDYLHVYLPTIRQASPRTITAYRISIECFITYLTSTGLTHENIIFDHLDRDHLKAWITWMKHTQNYSPRTISLRLSSIKAFLAYAAAEDITLMTLSLAAKTLKAPTPPKTAVNYLETTHTQAILNAWTGTTQKSRRNRMLLILLYDTAARVSELADLTTNDIRLDHPARAILTGKRNKTRTVPLSTQTVEHLHIYLSEFHPNEPQNHNNRPLFYSHHHGHPHKLSTDTISEILTQAGNHARNNDPSIPPRIHWHLLRKTKAMDLYKSGIPMPIIMQLLGHENMTTTHSFYAFATLDMMRTAINQATPPTKPENTALTSEQLKALYTLK